MSINPFGHFQFYSANFTCAAQEVAIEQIYDTTNVPANPGIMPLPYIQNLPHTPATTDVSVSYGKDDTATAVSNGQIIDENKGNNTGSINKKHKCRYLCAENFDEVCKQSLGSQYTALAVLDKKQFIIDHVQSIQVEGQKTGKSRRFAYFLFNGKTRLRVCQAFFLKTLGITKCIIDEALPVSTADKPDESSVENNTSNSSETIPEITRKSVQYHMECLLYVEKCKFPIDTSKHLLSGYSSMIDLYVLFLNKYKSDLPLDVLPSPVQYRQILHENYHDHFHGSSAEHCLLCQSYVTEPGGCKQTKDKERVAAPSKYALKRALLMPQPDQHKCRLNCNEEITEELRTELCKNYNSMDFCQRKNFILSHIRVLDVKRRKKTAVRHKEIFVAYYFSKTGMKVRVCKSFFLRTLRISDKVVSHAIDGMGPDGTFSQKDKRGGLRSTSFKKGGRTRRTIAQVEQTVQAASTCTLVPGVNAPSISCQASISSLPAASYPVLSTTNLQFANSGSVWNSNTTMCNILPLQNMSVDGKSHGSVVN